MIFFKNYCFYEHETIAVYYQIANEQVCKFLEQSTQLFILSKFLRMLMFFGSPKKKHLSKK